MKCPVCNIELRITDRQGIEIDYCPQCRGIWLDRGELDKLIERAAAGERSYDTGSAPRNVPQKRKNDYAGNDYADNDYAYEDRRPAAFDDGDADDRYRRRRDDDDDDDRRKYPRKKKSFLGDLFDIFD